MLSHFKIVDSFEELVRTPFENGLNALCWQRQIPGDFDEVARALGVGEGLISLDEDILRGLNISKAGKQAVEQLIQDLELLRQEGLAPSLDIIHSYPANPAPGLFPTDVLSYHVDTATDAADTYLCSYNVSSSEGLPNELARRKVDIPEIRAELLQIYGGADDAGFLEFLEEHFYDLHYTPAPGAEPYVFGIGNLWRIAVDYPGSPTLPCVHRAPAITPGLPARLLLIS
jgi:hypothetical protein